MCNILRYSSRFALSSMDMEQRDYDSRTALHVAAAEGKRRSSLMCQWVIPFGVFVELMCVSACVFQDTLRWFASCWRPVKSIQFPETGNARAPGNWLTDSWKCWLIRFKDVTKTCLIYELSKSLRVWINLQLMITKILNNPRAQSDVFKDSSFIMIVGN